MDFKYNFGLFKNRKLAFKYTDKEENYFSGVFKSGRQIKNAIQFVFKDGNILDILEYNFKKVFIEYDGETVYIIYDNKNENIISGMFAFGMFDTYGFPLELTEEIIAEEGLKIDIDGFNCLKRIQKENSSNSFKKIGAF